MTVEREHEPRFVELQVADEPASWAAAGFAVEGDRVRLGDVTIRLVGRDGAGHGIVGWTLSGVRIDEGSLDGLPTTTIELAELDVRSDSEGTVAPDVPSSHGNGARRLDHVVVLTPDLDRTIAACEDAGLDLRRIRDTTSYGSPMRQAFFRLGPTILEVVSGDTGQGRPADEAPASWFGLAIDVADLDETAARLGEALGSIKGAVQDGRRIATLRHEALGMSVAVAAMDDHGDR